MNQSCRWLFDVGLAFVSTGICVSLAQAQGNLPVATTGDQVVIKRETSRVLDPHRFRVPLSLEAIQTLTLVAPFDGTVKQIVLKTNSKIQGQGEVVRLDNDRQKLYLSRAQQTVKLAMVELKQAEKDETATALAQAKIDLANIDVEIAKSILDQTSVRSPFAGEVQRVLVTEGQFVRAGDPIAIVADNSKMKVEIPVDRASAENGKSFAIKIESSEVEGKIDAILPLPSRFDALRELFDSIASVQVVIENADNKFKVGQTVYVPFIPRQPVVEVPISAVGNLADGHRKVQVVRQFVVRDISVQILGQVGASRVFVSGPFAEGDEVIYEASHQLGDAFVLKTAAGATAGAAAPGANQPTVLPAGTQPKPTGF